MKNVTLLRFLTAVGSAVSTIAALDLAGVATVFDPATAKFMLAAGPAALAVKELVVVLGDWFDDGKPNKSFKVGMLCLALAFLALPMLTSCTTLPPISGTIATKDGQLTLQPDGRVVIVVEPHAAK